MLGVQTRVSGAYRVHTHCMMHTIIQRFLAARHVYYKYILRAVVGMFMPANLYRKEETRRQIVIGQVQVGLVVLKPLRHTLNSTFVVVRCKGFQTNVL